MLTFFASIYERSSHACDLEIPQAKGPLFLCLVPFPRLFSSSTISSSQCDEAWKLQCKEAPDPDPSENSLVTLQVINENSGRHWGCLWNVKQNGFYSGCLAAASVRSIKGLIVLLMGVSGTSLANTAQAFPWPVELVSCQGVSGGRRTRPLF